MRLLSAWLLVHKGQVKLVDFPNERSLPKYAILSHTWAEEEVLFDDLALGPNHEFLPDPTLVGAERSSQSTEADWEDSEASNCDIASAASSEIGDLESIDLEGTEPMSAEQEYVAAGSSKVPIPHVKAGWTKVLNTCLQACKDELDYVWIDTCCIDKRSSAELSEAINSMYRWYEEAAQCYVYLADCRSKLESQLEMLQKMVEVCTMYQSVLSLYGYSGPSKREIQEESNELDTNSDAQITFRLKGCRWFTRGWTLQELIAPYEIKFFDQQWRFVAKKSDILSEIESITGVHKQVLGFTNDGLPKSPREFSIAQRMFWASKRMTTRVEDEAYCLLGIFGINMPLIYGEGNKAFQRLQEEIIGVSTDQSILAWELRPDGTDRYQADRLLAPSAANFWWHAKDIIQLEGGDPNYALHAQDIPFDRTKRSIKTKLLLHPWRQKHDCGVSIAYLDCFISKQGGARNEAQVGLRLLNPTLFGFARTCVVQEDVSTFEEPKRSFRRLAYLKSARLIVDADEDSDYSHQVTITLEADNLLRRSLYDFTDSLISIRMDFPRWKVIAAHPRSEWYEDKSEMVLPFRQSAVFGSVVVENIDKLRITILFGQRGKVHHYSWAHWIFPGPPSFYDLRSAKLFLPCSAEHLYGLPWLCEQANSFSPKDFFENSKRRPELRKAVLCPNGDVLRLSVRTWAARPNQYLPTYVEQRLNFVLRIVSESSPRNTKFSDPEFATLRLAYPGGQCGSLPADFDIQHDHYKYPLCWPSFE